MGTIIILSYDIWEYHNNDNNAWIYHNTRCNVEKNPTIYNIYHNPSYDIELESIIIVLVLLLCKYYEVKN